MAKSEEEEQEPSIWTKEPSPITALVPLGIVLFLLALSKWPSSSSSSPSTTATSSAASSAPYHHHSSHYHTPCSYQPPQHPPKSYSLHLVLICTIIAMLGAIYWLSSKDKQLRGAVGKFRNFGNKSEDDRSGPVPLPRPQAGPRPWGVAALIFIVFVMVVLQSAGSR